VGEFSYVKFPQDIVHQKLFKSIQFLPIISTYKGILFKTVYNNTQYSLYTIYIPTFNI